MTFGTISCRLMKKQSCSSQNATRRSGAPNTPAFFPSSVPTTRNLDDALTAPSDREQKKIQKGKVKIPPSENIDHTSLCCIILEPHEQSWHKFEGELQVLQ
jgi:hypothetical protein